MDKKYAKCRLCLKLGDFSSIFEFDESIKLSEMVMSFANIHIHEGDGFSDRVCNSCIENLSTAYLFKLQCERIDDLLRKTQGPQEHYTTATEGDQDHFTTATDFDSVWNKEIFMRSNKTAQGQNDENTVKDKSNDSNDQYHDVSDETDSDMDSVKCVYCSQSYNTFGAHRCHVTCTIEREQLQQSSSNETLVATDRAISVEDLMITANEEPAEDLMVTASEGPIHVSCILCDDKFEDYDAYVLHVNKCTNNVKLHHYVCPVCHSMFGDKLAYLKHVKSTHLKVSYFSPNVADKENIVSRDCVDNFVPMMEKTRRPTSVRRQIGWSIEDIYQEIDCKPINKETPSSSPIKNFFSKLNGNESFSRQSTPKRVSFRKLIEDGKNKTANFPFKKYIPGFKKKNDAYSPIKGKMQVSTQILATLPEIVSDSEYGSPSGTSEESWKMKQNLICACDKKVFMLSEVLSDRERISAMINELGGVVAENTKMEMLATHFISVLPNDTFTGMMVCALATGKWLLHVNYIYDSFRGKRFLEESLYEWKKNPKILEVDNTSVEVANAAVYWHLELSALHAKYPFEGKQLVLIMKKKYRQYYQMIFKTLKAKPVTYDPRTPGSCCSADYCFVDMKIIERVKLKFFAHHNVPVFPYQYILVHLLSKGHVKNADKYLIQDCNKYNYLNDGFMNKTF